jgi:hypothetical protein
MGSDSPGLHIDVFRNDRMIGRPVRVAESVGNGRRKTPFFQQGRPKLVRNMVNSTYVQRTLGSRGEERVSFEKKELERTGLGSGPWPCGAVTESGFRAMVPPCFVRTYSPRVDESSHAGMDVVEVKTTPCDLDRKRLVAGQRIEPNTRQPHAVMNVGAHVQLEKIRKPGNAWKSLRMDPPHEERHDRKPRFSFESIDKQSGRKRPLNFARVPRPMQEEKPLPSHLQDRPACWPFPCAKALLESGWTCDFQGALNFRHASSRRKSTARLGSIRVSRVMFGVSPNKVFRRDAGKCTRDAPQ